MKYWRRSGTVEAFVTLSETLSKEVDVDRRHRRVNQLISFNSSRTSRLSSTSTARDGRFIVEAGESRTAPDVRDDLAADDAHLSSADELRAVMAITGRIKVRVPATAC